MSRYTYEAFGGDAGSERENPEIRKIREQVIRKNMRKLVEEEEAERVARLEELLAEEQQNREIEWLGPFLWRVFWAFFLMGCATISIGVVAGIYYLIALFAR